MYKILKQDLVKKTIQAKLVLNKWFNSQYFQLFIESKPTIRTNLPAKDPTVIQGIDTSFECDFYGYPFPTVKWFKDGKELSSDTKYRLENGNRKLTLVKANHNEHNGKYQCEATNEGGTETTREMTVAVTCKLNSKLNDSIFIV